MNRLKAVEGPLTGLIFTIPDEPRVIVGRNDAYDLVIPDSSLSRKHFAIEKKDDGIFLVDLGSLNGTQLNSSCVSTARLETGDKISAGQTVLLFESDEDCCIKDAPALQTHSAKTVPIETTVPVNSNIETDALPMDKCAKCEKLIFGEDINAGDAVKIDLKVYCKGCQPDSSN